MNGKMDKEGVGFLYLYEFFWKFFLEYICGDRGAGVIVWSGFFESEERVVRDSLVFRFYL